MPLIPWLTGSIAGVSIVDANGNSIKCQIEHGGDIRTSFIASHVPAVDGTAWTQVIQVGISGKPFSIIMPHIPLALFGNIKAAIEASLVSVNPSFAFSLTDTNATYAGNASIGPTPWFDYPPGRANGLNIEGNTVLRLVGKP